MKEARKPWPALFILVFIPFVCLLWKDSNKRFCGLSKWTLIALFSYASLRSGLRTHADVSEGLPEPQGAHPVCAPRALSVCPPLPDSPRRLWIESCTFLVSCFWMQHCRKQVPNLRIIKAFDCCQFASWNFHSWMSMINIKETFNFKKKNRFMAPLNPFSVSNWRMLLKTGWFKYFQSSKGWSDRF